MPKNVFANGSYVLSLPDGNVRTVTKDTRYDASDAVVAAHPWAFDGADGAAAPEPKRRVRRRATVEQATAAPGELRDL